MNKESLKIEIDYKTACIIKHALKNMIVEKKDIVVKSNAIGDIAAAKRAAGDLISDKCVYRGIKEVIDIMMGTGNASERYREIKEFAINLEERLEELAKLKEGNR